MLRENDAAFAEEGDAPHGVPQFAQVARPFVVQKHLHRGGMDRGDALAGSAAAAFNSMAMRGREILQPLAQQRNQSSKAIEPVVKVFAKLPVPDPLAQRAVGGGDDAGVGAEHLFAAQALEFAVFDGSQDLRLSERAHVGDLVEEERAVVGELEFAFDRCCAPVKAPRSWPKSWLSSSVSLMADALKETKAPRARGGIVDRLRKQRFAGTGSPRRSTGMSTFAAGRRA